MTQQEEIKTINSKKFVLNLSDADVDRIFKKAGSVGLTVSELLENFIGDLVDGTYSNGSDERMQAESWFERCWFGMFQDSTLLRYLIANESVDEFIETYQEVDSYLYDFKDDHELLNEKEILSCYKSAVDEYAIYYKGYVNEELRANKASHDIVRIIDLKKEIDDVIRWDHEKECLKYETVD